MPLPHLEPDDIVEQFSLPTISDVFGALKLSEDVLNVEVASSDDLHKKGNNPPSYSNVRSMSEMIEDEYDGFVQQLYHEQMIHLSHEEVIKQFKAQANQRLATLVVVKNNGRAYEAAPNAVSLEL